MVEHRPCNPAVMGSIPISGSNNTQVRRVKAPDLFFFSPRTSPYMARLKESPQYLRVFWDLFKY